MHAHVKKNSGLVGAPTGWLHTEVEQIQYNMIGLVITMSCPAHEHASFSSMVRMWLTVPHWLALSAGTFSPGALMWSKPMGVALKLNDLAFCHLNISMPPIYTRHCRAAFGCAYFESCFDAGTQAYSHTHSNVLQVKACPPKIYPETVNQENFGPKIQIETWELRAVHFWMYSDLLHVPFRVAGVC